MATAKQKKGAAPSTASARRRPTPAQLKAAADKRAAERAAEREAKRKAFRERQAESWKNVAETARANAEAVCALAEEEEGPPPDFKKEGWTERLGTHIARLVVTGLSLKKIARRPGMPGLSTMLWWLGDAKHPFGAVYKEAKDRMVPFLEEEALDVSLDPREGETTLERDSEEQGLTRETRRADAVERSRLAFTAIQWTLGHLRPKKHGRNADPEAGQPNDQLKALFESLNEGPVD